MPEIKHQFSGGKMNKDLDERMVPNGEYRDAMNIQVSTSEGSDVGTVQNILGNKEVPFEFIDHNGSPFSFQLPLDAVVVGSISDEKIDTLYWFIWTSTHNLIISHKRNDKLSIVFYDTKNVLKFEPNNIITGINVIDDMLFWTDNRSEPKKINVFRCARGTRYPDHTRVINDQQGITWGDGVDVEEKHITVIKKTPPVTMEMRLETARDLNKIYTGVVVTTQSGINWIDANGNTQDPFNFSGINTTDNNIVNPAIFTGIDSLGNEVTLGPVNQVDGLTGWHRTIPAPNYTNTSFQGNIPIGTKVVFKPFDDDDTPPGLPVTDYVLKGVIEDAYPAIYDPVTQTWSSNPPNTTWSNGVRVKITSIDGFPPLPDSSQGQTELKYVVDFFDETEKLFEFKFPRFSYRYKYEDGEHSPYAPFTEVAFVPGAFDYHPRKGYNIGMTNRLTKVELGKFIHDDMPKDVVSVDILFKDEASPNIYVVDTIRPDDDVSLGGTKNAWNTVKDNKYYIIDKETVNNIVASNQLLRPWDNVPRKALAQDITGNRIVYANYVQNYNLIYNGKKHLADFKFDWDKFPAPLTESAKSIKSLREYQLGVVFIDKYGRETPVISNTTGTRRLEKDSADKNNRIKIGLKGNAPEDLTYFKFFVKETANEYYNMAMDRWYRAEDGNIWLAFPSSDRNKIDIDTFLVLKKGSDQDTLVKAAARYKVLAIESEAPDFIKTSKILVSSQSHFAASKDIFSSGGTDVPLLGVDNFKLNFKHYHGSSAQNLDKIEDEIYISFGKFGSDEVSNRYRVTSIANDWDGQSSLLSVTGDESTYSIRIEGNLQDDVNFISNDPSGTNSTFIADGAIVNIYKYKVENKPRFDGRFFVKIYFDDVFRANISKEFDGDAEYRVTDSRPVYSMKGDMKAKHTSSVGNFLVNGSPPNNQVYSTNYGYYENNSFASFALYFRRYKKSTTMNNVLLHLEPGTQTAVSVPYLNNYWNDVDGGEEMGFGIDDGYTAYWTTIKENRTPSDNDNARDTEVWFIDNGPAVAYRTSDYSLYWPGLNFWGNQPNGFVEDTSEWRMDLGFGGLKTQDEQTSPPNFFNIGDWNGPDPNGTNSDYKDLATKQFVEKLNPGYRFRWKEDPDQTIYTIQKAIGGSGRGQYLRHSRSSSDYLNTTGTNMAENISFNFTKNWYISKITPKLIWNPWNSDEITGGQVIELPAVTNGVNTSSGGAIDIDLKIFVESLEDASGNRLNIGMALSEYSNAAGVDGTLQTHLGANSNKFLVVRHIVPIPATNPDYYELWLGGYSKPMTTIEHALVNTTASVPAVGGSYKFVQVGMNGYSPNSEFNINTMAHGQNFGKIGAVGYTLQFLELIEPEEILSENPAIWETEPKDAKDLDIYYEATSAVPMKFNGDNIHEAIPIGSMIKNLNPLYTCKVIGYDITDPLFPQLQLEVPLSPPLVTLPGIPDVFRVVRPDGLEFGVSITTQNSSYIVSPWSGEHYITPDPDIYNANFFLAWHNCYSFGNGVESDRIRDNFNLPFIANGVKVSTTLEQEYKEEHRKYGLIYSGIYNSISGVNNLNQFIQAEKITKDVNPIYGSIQKIHSRDSDLVTLCEDKCLRIMSNKDALFNADGNTNLTATSKVLGQTIPFGGEFGISTNPESFASESYRVYFADKVRGVILRLSKDGLTPISAYGMKDWFRDNLKLTNKLIGSYDDRNDEYNITLTKHKGSYPISIIGTGPGGGAID